ncbi:MAG: protein translocase subunit SecD [Candidatus Eisenbacteria bacterium]|uniref:Protein translocase subunit SecD n=1 Tax=Eiseniibacteriota bacterium TaxID=2212470 RepID=A0A538THJ9_UNCEI|nr:MAG: protein translocase subunit SecD [Candidatus Eisenbacteria bacterium]
MTQTDQRKFFGTIIGVAVCLYTLWPTFQFYTLSPEKRQEVLRARPADARDEGERTRLEKLAKLREKAIKLGLDLQGGMYLLLEVDKSKLGPAEAKNAVDQAMQIIRNRIDQFGVAEPSIQKQGDNRILIQLPGLLDRERAKELIGQTALLEFKLVKTDEETRAILDRIDSYFARKKLGVVPDTTAPDSLRHPLTSHFLFVGQRSESFALSSEVAAIDSMLSALRADSTFALDATLAWDAHETDIQGRTGRVLYVLTKEPLMRGSEVASAQMRLDLDQERPGAPGVSFTLTSRGGAIFADITGANVGRRLAIVLDGRIQSAPNIQERIPRGQGSITGSFTEEEGQNLAIVLRSGALPAPVNIVEERTVGPSLGQDSIQKGLHAGAIGTLLVVLFMIVYYRLSGVVAVVTLLLNIIALLAAMAGFHATLTLPGIAGIVLTVGMAVDANVLIFERIREELRNKRTVLAAIDTGYSRAFRTIVDAHVTTLLSAVALMWFGTGPVRGFAVTLSIGLIINMITAVGVSKMIFDAWSLRRKVSSISI